MTRLLPQKPFNRNSRARPVVLVSLDWIRPGDPPFGLGTASVASSLRSIGSDVTIVTDAVNRPGFSAPDFISDVTDTLKKAGSEALVGVGAYVWCEPEVQTLIGTVDSKADVVLGGPKISFVPAGQLEEIYPRVRYFVRGHGGKGMVDLALGIEKNGVSGLHIAGSRDLGARADYPLENLPSPHLDGTIQVGDFVRWETQRGCTFSCSFCQHKQPGDRLSRSLLGTDRLKCEMLAFHEFGTQRISVLDPIFNTDNKRSIALIDEMKLIGLKSHLSFQCRFEFVTDAFLDAIAPLSATLEFGLQTVIDDEARAIGRPNRMDKIEEVVAKLNCRRIPYEISLIYGLPFQTLESFQKSVDWCMERNVPKVRAWPLMLLRGTPLHAERERYGYVESVGERIPLAVESSYFSRADHAEMAKISTYLEETGKTTS